MRKPSVTLSPQPPLFNVYYDTFHRGLTFTLSGVYTLCLILFVGLIAITTGINGLYVFLSCGLGGYVISGVLSERAIRNVRIASVGALHLDADQPCTVFFTIENKSRTFTIFGIETQFFTATPRYRLIAGARHPLARHRSTVLPPNSSLVMPATCNGFRRGYYDQLKVMNLTTFPLGILEKYKITNVPAQILVSSKVDLEWLEILERDLRLAMRSLELGPEFYMHLPYRNDNAHLLDWRKNAGKMSKNWVVKDLRSDTKRTQVIVETVWADTGNITRENAYEAYLSRIRTAIEASRKLGLDVVLRVDKKKCVFAMDQILLFLACAPRFEDRLSRELYSQMTSNNLKNDQPLPSGTYVTLRVTDTGIEGPTYPHPK